MGMFLTSGCERLTALFLLTLEWYDPSAITTADGKLVITMTEVENHDLNFMSGMLQSWNKFCFTTGANLGLSCHENQLN